MNVIKRWIGRYIIPRSIADRMAESMRQTENMMRGRDAVLGDRRRRALRNYNEWTSFDNEENDIP
jgi:hypothetical protein